MHKIIMTSTIAIVFFLVVGLVFFTPTITAKTKYKTAAYDKKIASQQDFDKGTTKNIKVEEKMHGALVGPEDGQAGEYITEVIEAPFEATHIGLHWKEGAQHGAPLMTYMRTSDDGENFSEWTEIHVMEEEGKDGFEKEEQFGYLVGANDHRYAQARIVFESQNGSSKKLKEFTFTFIDAMQEADDTFQNKKVSFVPRITAADLGIGTEKTSLHGQSLHVISREQWEANEDFRKTANGDEDWPRSYHGTRKIVIHHTANDRSNGEDALETNMAEMRAIYYYHAVTNKWGDIGYNAVVDAAGNVYEGRYGTPGESFTRTTPSADDIMVLDVEGAHASSYNAGSFGVSAMGNFEAFEIPEAQQKGLENVLTYVADNRGIDVQGRSDFRRYDGDWHNDLENVYGHGDAVATACPGAMLYDNITAMRSAVNSTLDVDTSNISGFDAMIDGADISGQSISSGNITFDWDAFIDAVAYEYALEKVFGTIANPQPWESAWMNSVNLRTTSDLAVAISTNTLEPHAQYVFYFKAIDANGVALSTVEHVNFTTDELAALDTIAPTIESVVPTEGYEAAEKERMTITVQASDNVGVARLEILFDGTSKAICTNTTECSVMILMRKEAVGDHTIDVVATDAAGNAVDQSVAITKAGSISDEPDDPKPVKCHPKKGDC